MTRCRLPRRRQGGFTLVELMLATTILMALLFGAIYSTRESFSVVKEGDARVHTHIHVRRALDRLLKDCRYSADLDVQGAAGTGWTITVDATSDLDPDVLSYSWDPADGTLRITDPAAETEDIVASGITAFEVATEMVDVEGVPEVATITLHWTVDVVAGAEAGLEQATQSVEMGGSTRIRRTL